MSTLKGGNQSWRFVRLMFGFAFLAFVVAIPQLHAADKDEEEYDSYKLRIDALWFNARPTGSFEGAGHTGFIDFQKDLELGTYSTFTGKLDWKFTRKNHLFFAATPFDRIRHVVLNRTVVFRGQTFNAGLAATGELNVLALVPGYQYDFIRRKRGHLGVIVQLDLFDVTGTLNAAAQVTNGVPRAAVSSRASLRAPIPVAGPDVRLYLIPHSGRLFVTGNVLGMYLFGYGNFVSTFDTLGVTLTKHLSVRGGYSLASRLEVNTKTSRVGLSLTQKGPVAGLEFSF
jgi:hypothetical protein